MPKFLKLIELGRTEEVRRALIEARERGVLSSHIRCVDPSGLTPMHYAAAYGGADIIEILHEYGADLNAKGTRNQIAPLHLAAIQDVDFVINKLISLGADKDIKDINGISALDSALNMAPDKIPFKSIKALVTNGVEITNFSAYVKAILCGARKNELDALKELEQYAIDSGRGEVFPSIIDTTLEMNSLAVHAILGLAPEVLEYVLMQEDEKRKHIGDLSDSLELVVAKPRPTPFHYIKEVFPPLSVMMLPYKLLSDRANNELATRETLLSILGEINVNVNIKFSGTKYYIHEISNVLLNFNFDEDGNILNKDEIMTRLDKVIGILVAHGYDINQTFKRESAVGVILDYPVEVLEIFCKHGARFNINDLHKAMLECDGDKVKYILSKGVDVVGLGSRGKTTRQILDECENDKILSARPDLMKIISEMEKKQEEAIKAGQKRKRVSQARQEAEDERERVINLSEGIEPVLSSDEERPSKKSRKSLSPEI